MLAKPKDQALQKGGVRLPTQKQLNRQYSHTGVGIVIKAVVLNPSASADSLALQSLSKGLSRPISCTNLKSQIGVTPISGDRFEKGRWEDSSRPVGSPQPDRDVLREYYNGLPVLAPKKRITGCQPTAELERQRKQCKARKSGKNKIESSKAKAVSIYESSANSSKAQGESKTASGHSYGIQSTPRRLLKQIQQPPPKSKRVTGLAKSSSAKKKLPEGRKLFKDVCKNSQKLILIRNSGPTESEPDKLSNYFGEFASKNSQNTATADSENEQNSRSKAIDRYRVQLFQCHRRSGVQAVSKPRNGEPYWLSESDFSNSGILYDKVWNHILKERLVKDQEYDCLYEEVIDRFPEYEQRFRDVLVQLLQKLDN